MASFQKRGKTWQYTISAKPRPIRKSGFRTKKEAEIAAAEMEMELQKGTTPKTREVSFAEYFREWIEVFKKDVSPITLKRYENSLETIENYFGHKTIQSINKRSYQAFLNEYALTHAKSTTRKLNTHVRACVRDAIDEELIRLDFTRNAKLSGSVESKRPEDKHLDYNESQTLLKALYKRLDKSLMYYLLLLGLTSGMRYGELVGLTREDFNFFNNTINIDKQWDYKNGTGFMETKNEKSVRVIKMDDETMDAFKALFKKTPDNIHRLVFFSPNSKYKTFSNDGANKALKNLLDELKIKHISVHGLRHSHSAILLFQKVSIYYVSERLGHGDIETTHSYYAHVIKEMRERDETSTINTFKAMF